MIDRYKQSEIKLCKDLDKNIYNRLVEKLIHLGIYYLSINDVHVSKSKQYIMLSYRGIFICENYYPNPRRFTMLRFQRKSCMWNDFR